MVLERDPRCKMISLDPDTSEHNPEVLRKVAQAHSLRFFESFPHHLHEILLACTNNFHILAVAMKHEHSKYCNCLYYSANALARVLTKMAEEEFAVTGLAPSYAFLLMTVNGKPGIQPTEISAHMQLTPSTVTRLIEKMEHRRLLERKSAGKFTQVFPTEKSKKLDKKIREAWMSLYQRYSDVLGEVKGRKLTDEVYQAIEKLTG
jgi:DNA-binding MarR family transcriptional regulator